MPKNARPIDIVTGDLDKLAELQARVRNKWPGENCKPWAREEGWVRVMEMTAGNVTSALQNDAICCQFHAMCELTMYYFLCGWEAALMKIEGWEPD